MIRYIIPVDLYTCEHCVQQLDSKLDSSGFAIEVKQIQVQDFIWTNHPAGNRATIQKKIHACVCLSCVLIQLICYIYIVLCINNKPVFTGSHICVFLISPRWSLKCASLGVCWFYFYITCRVVLRKKSATFLCATQMRWQTSFG